MGFQGNEITGIRWLSCVNKSNEEIPPYAIMMLHDYSNRETRGYGAYEQDGQAVWYVNKCDALMEEHQNAACLFVNSNEPIPKGKPGRCTRDWPAQVAHDGSFDKLGPGMPCGPRKDSWFVWSTGTALACMGHNAGDKPAKKHTVWVSNERIASNAIWGSFRTDFSSFETGEQIYIANQSINNSTPTAELPPTLSDSGIGLEDGDVKILRASMRVMFNLTALIFADNSVPGGTSLSIRISHQRDGKTLGSYSSSRDQDIEKACSGGTSSVITLFVTKEMITIAGQFCDLRKGDTISLTNTSGVTITVGACNLEIIGIISGGFQVGTANNS